MPIETDNTSKAIAELSDDVKIAKQIAAAVKAKDYAALAAIAPEAARELREDWAAVKAAMPEIKAGYKTTEFWLTVGVLALNAGWLVVKGQALPFDVNATLSALVGLYGIVRAIAKKPAATA